MKLEKGEKSFLVKVAASVVASLVVAMLVGVVSLWFAIHTRLKAIETQAALHEQRISRVESDFAALLPKVEKATEHVAAIRAILERQGP